MLRVASYEAQKAIKQATFRITFSFRTVLRRIFGSERDEVTGEWRKLHNEELNDQQCSPNNIRVIISRRMRWVGHVTRMRGEEMFIQGFGGEM